MRTWLRAWTTPRVGIWIEKCVAVFRISQITFFLLLHSLEESQTVTSELAVFIISWRWFTMNSKALWTAQFRLGIHIEVKLFKQLGNWFGDVFPKVISKCSNVFACLFKTQPSKLQWFPARVVPCFMLDMRICNLHHLDKAWQMLKIYWRKFVGLGVKQYPGREKHCIQFQITMTIQGGSPPAAPLDWRLIRMPAWAWYTRC